MAEDIKFADFSIDGVESWGEDVPSRVGVETFPRRHGGIVPDIAFLGPRTVSLVGKVFKDTDALLKTYLEDLSQKLTDNGRSRLFLRDDNRFLNAIKIGFSYRFLGGEPFRVARFAIDFVAGDPFWYSETQNENNQAGISSSPHSFSITYNGKVKTPPIIQIKAVGADRTDVKLTSTTIGFFVRFAGTITSGNTLTIDHSKFTVQNGGSNGLNDFTGTFWQLEPGLNNLTYEGPTTVDIKVLWTDRFA